MNNWPAQDHPTCIEASQLRPGDILLTCSQDGLSRRVQHATGDRYTHASIYLGGGQVGEATLQGVQRNPLEIPKKGHIAVFRHQLPFTVDRALALNAFVDEMIAAGAGYDESAKSEEWVKALRAKQKDYEANWLEKLEAYFALSAAAGPQNLLDFMCSAFVATCYFKVGILGDTMNATLANPEVLLPQDLGGAHFFYGHIVGYLAPPDHQIPVDDPFYNRSRWTFESFD